jgi:hypothetical protein
MQNPLYKKTHPEDQSICIHNKDILKNNLGIYIAPLKIANQFAFERAYRPTFGFHGFFNFAKILDSEELKKMIEIIPASLLGKIDTYDLIEDLCQKKQSNLANLLLTRSSPKRKMWKKHLHFWLSSWFNRSKGKNA